MLDSSLILLVQGGPGQDNPLIGMLLPMALIAAIFYFLIFRPMKKRQKQQEDMISGLKNGDRVVTSAGIHGTVAGMNDRTVFLKVADNVKIEISKVAIAEIQPSSSDETK